MAEKPATVTYLVPEPFDEAVRTLRRALAATDLKVTCELDMSRRIRRELMISTAPCLVLFVGPPAAVMQSFEADAGAAAFTPLHIVVSAKGAQTEIHILRVLPPGSERLAIAALGQLQAVVAHAIQKIGMRTAVGA
jgi:uncharacterized protein (DUF302 family)